MWGQGQASLKKQRSKDIKDRILMQWTLILQRRRLKALATIRTNGHKIAACWQPGGGKAYGKGSGGASSTAMSYGSPPDEKSKGKDDKGRGATKVEKNPKAQKDDLSNLIDGQAEKVKERAPVL